MIKNKLFTTDDITHFPDNDGNWFYGLVKDNNKIGLYEIHPGIGYSKISLSYRPKIYLWMIRDAFNQLFCAYEIPRLSEAEYNRRQSNREKEIKEAKTWNPDSESLSDFLDND